MWAGTPLVQQIIPQVLQFPPATDCGPAPTYVQAGIAEVVTTAFAELLNPTLVENTVKVDD
jgi:hypothetical protein